MAERKYITNNPSLINEWDFEKNNLNGLDSLKLVEGSNKKAWWICSVCSHEWEAQIQKRAIRGQGCPICGKKKQLHTQEENRCKRLIENGEGTLADKFPNLLLEWDYDKNMQCGLNPSRLASGSNKKANWKCRICGYEWEAQIIKRTTRAQGCPICGRKKQLQIQAENLLEKIKEEGSFADHFPDLIDEWDYNNNEKTPFDYLPHSNVVVSWVCSKCGNHWQAPISNRTNGNGCAKCGRIAAKRTLLTNLIESNGSLADNNSCLVKEWHPTKNLGVTPSDVMANSNRKAWWKCQVCGYEWEANISNRNLGHGCPHCRANEQRLAQSTPIEGVNDLASQNPTLALEWHPTRNHSLTPKDIAKSSNKKVWWLGKCGHEWEATVGSRFSGRGCPICVREFKISYPEKALFYYIEKALNNYNVIENYKPDWLQGKEIDIYIEQLRFGIEYDGVAWHKNAETDNEKDAICRLHNVDLLRVREKGSPQLICQNILWVKNCSENEIELISAIQYVFDYLHKSYGIKCNINIDLEKDRIPIYSLLELQKKTNSLAVLFPEVAKQWHPEKNGYLTPEYVSAHTHKAFWWICPCGHEYMMDVKHKTEKGAKCPICSNHRVLAGFNDLQTKRPDIAAEWHPVKNGLLTPADVMEFSNKKVWWICPEGHSYEYIISHRTRKVCKCPICTNRRLCVGVNDLYTVNPDVTAEWNFEMNGVLKPEQFTPISGKRIWWKCSVCNHEWETKISDRYIYGHGCQKCAGKRRWETRIKNAKQHNL